MALIDSFRQLTDAIWRGAPDNYDLGPFMEELASALGCAVEVTAPLGETPLSAGHSASATHSGRGGVVEPTTKMVLQGPSGPAGILTLRRAEADLSEDEWLLAEYGATIISLLMGRAREVRAATRDRQRMQVSAAIEALSYSELIAAQRLFAEIHENQGLVITSHVADEMGITRSVIVNALRKLESAGVIQTRSLGMKGTHIRVLNDQLKNAFEALTL
jgi:transcriptional pleiotropic repressor